MTDEKKPTPQEYWKGFPEAPASDTFKWVDAKGFEHMTTLRAWSADGLEKQISTFSEYIEEAGGKNVRDSFAKGPNPFDAPQETRTALDDSGNEITIKSLTVEKVDVSMANGKTYYKVMGAPLTKFGVNVWPEVFANAGFATLDPQNPPNVVGWHAEYVEKQKKDGSGMTPDKVTRLLPPK